MANCSNKITYSGKIINQNELQDINFENKKVNQKNKRKK